uniref:Uncharacterized protein n=1 Tax=Anguilla anguilla TaxID=7936 RepID=A0A0E9STB1_ANGAN
MDWTVRLPVTISTGMVWHLVCLCSFHWRVLKKYYFLPQFHRPFLDVLEV